MSARIELNKEDVRNKIHQVKTQKELAKLCGCGVDVIRKYLLENDLYNEYCLTTGREPKTELKYCCICNSNHRVETYQGKPYCKKHLNHMRRYGKIIEKTIYDKNDYIFEDDIVKIILRDKYQKIVGECIIDKKNYDKVKDYKWYLSYGYCKTKGINKDSGIAIHNVIMDNLEYVDIILYDHRDKNKLNNRESNLRLATDQENAMNMSMKCTNTSGVTGVVAYTNDSILKWDARITYNYENIYLGRFIDFDKAVLARLKGEVEYFKEYSPNYNKDKNAICLEYISQMDNNSKYIEMPLN